MTCCSVCGTLTDCASGLCDYCLDDLALLLDADSDGPEIVSVRPGETPREITDTHLPGDDRR